jgi:hypothetical protein
MSKNSKATHAQTANEIAADHDISPSRVRQYAAAGRLPRQGRGRFDALYFACLRSGEAICQNRRRKPAAPVLVALGWLEAGEREDRALLIDLLERNGLGRADALEALGEAKARLRTASERV